MRIAILGSVALPIPPPAQGGTEWIAYHQALGLSGLNHKILLFAASGSKQSFTNTNIEVIEVGKGDVVTGSGQEQHVNPQLAEGSRKLRQETAYLSEVALMLIQRAQDYDIILGNMRGEAVFLPVARLLHKPFVQVMHLNMFAEMATVFSLYGGHLISISQAQRKEFPDLNYLATVYNGIDVAQFPQGEGNGDYLLMMGSIGEHKNQQGAINVAKKLGMKLVLAGKVRDVAYFESMKKDIDGEQIKHLGEISFEEKIKLYQGAKAFLFPIVWEEPFGLVMIEAMACGTPVVAFNHGAIPEVVVDGVTGFVVANEEQMVEAVGKIDTIDRAACRKHVEDNFTVKEMIASYEKALFTISP